MLTYGIGRNETNTTLIVLRAAERDTDVVNHPNRSKRPSQTMLATLRAMARDGGGRTFMSGFPTYEALAQRELITISGTDNIIYWRATLTDAGWEASGVVKVED